MLEWMNWQIPVRDLPIGLLHAVDPLVLGMIQTVYNHPLDGQALCHDCAIAASEFVIQVSPSATWDQ